MQNLKTVKIRGQFVAVVLLVIGSIFVGRLFYLQVIKHDYYNSQALAEHQKQYEIPAKRGTIYFKDGSDLTPVVMNQTVYTLYADQTLIKDAKKTAHELDGLVPGTSMNQLAKDLTVVDNKPKQYIVLANRLSEDQKNKILDKELSGINVIPVQQRVYPDGNLGAQLLGFVDSDGEGQYGVEGAMNKQLSGTPGRLKAITDVNGVPLAFSPDNVAEQPKNGQNLALTIDRNVQFQVQEILKRDLPKVMATRGSVIVMNPNNGAIVAMANYPSYDPSKYYDVKDYSLYGNRVVNSPYEMGSVMKVLTMATGLDTGAISPHSTFNNTGHVHIDDFDITNVDEVPGVRTMTEILQYSLNTGAVWIVQQLGGHDKIDAKSKQVLYNYFTQHYGFGSNTGVEQADEAPGFIAKPADSSQVRYANMAFGQGLTTTMVQYSAAFSSVINGGKYYQPHVVEGTVDSDGYEDIWPQKELRRSVSTQASKEVTSMMVNARRLVPGVSAGDPAGYQIGGKTGSAQIIDKKTGKYLDNLSVGSYIGFTGNPVPKFVIMVRVDDSKLPGFAGGAAAGPIFSDINKWLINYYRMAPQ